MSGRANLNQPAIIIIIIIFDKTWRRLTQACPPQESDGIIFVTSIEGTDLNEWIPRTLISIGTNFQPNREWLQFWDF